MAEEQKIKKFAGFVDSWWKIITVLVALVLFIYNVLAVWIQIKEVGARQDQLDNKVEQYHKEQEDDLADRHKRYIEMYKDLRDHGLELTKGYQEHLIEDAYFRGRMDAKIEMLEKR